MVMDCTTADSAPQDDSPPVPGAGPSPRQHDLATGLALAARNVLLVGALLALGINLRGCMPSSPMAFAERLGVASTMTSHYGNEAGAEWCEEEVVWHPAAPLRLLARALRKAAAMPWGGPREYPLEPAVSAPEEPVPPGLIDSEPSPLRAPGEAPGPPPGGGQLNPLEHPSER